MEFAFTEEQELLRRAVREFADSFVAPEVPTMEETAQPPLGLIKAIGEMGYLGVAVPGEYGGSGMGYTTRMIVLAERPAELGAGIKRGPGDLVRAIRIKGRRKAHP